MIFEELNGSTVIIELSESEMKEYSVTYDTLNSEDEKTKSAVKKILKRAGELYGKIPHSEKVTVEALPSDNGGCFFIFTFPERKLRYRVKKADSNALLETETVDGILDYVSAVKGAFKTCRLYYSDSKYYLSVPKPCENDLRIMTEFGKVHKETGIHIYKLMEHGKFMGKITV